MGGVHASTDAWVHGQSRGLLCLDRAVAGSRHSQGIPPLGWTCDGGTSNNMLRCAALGTLDPAQMRSTPFFNECVTEAMNLPRVPLGRLVYAGHPLFFSLDCLHVLKRFAAHHGSGARVVEWGEAWTDLSCGLGCGLPVKAFVQHDSQSDRAALQVLSPINYPVRWDAFGAHVMILVSALLSAAWEGGGELCAEERFLNASLCYFVVLLNRARAALVHGVEWTTRFLPQITCRNVCQACVCAMQLAIWLPNRVSFSSRAFAEKCCEQHFSRLKAGFQGTPSVRDAVLSACKVHMQNFREAFVKPQTQHSRISRKRAQELLEVSFQDAVSLQSWICVGVSRDKIQKELAFLILLISAISHAHHG